MEGGGDASVRFFFFFFFFACDLIREQINKEKHILFLQAYITCELGVDWVGYAMLCFGICDTVASPVAGLLGKYVKRTPLFFAAASLNVATLICMLLWQPKASEKYVFFLLPAMWGIADGIWQTQSGGEQKSVELTDVTRFLDLSVYSK